MELVAELKGHADRVWAVAWSPQGDLASCAGDGSVKIWHREGAEWKCTATMQEHGQTVRSVAWSHKGDLLACASFDKSASICQKTADGWCAVASLEAHENEVKAVAFSRFDNCIATCSRDKSIAIWEESTENVAPGQVDYECAFISNSGGHAQDVKFVTWHPKKEYLVSCSYDDTVKLWKEDPESKDDWFCMQTLHGHSSTVWMAAFSPEGDMLATCSDDSDVIIWQCMPGPTPEWKKACTLTGQHTRTIYAVDWCEHGLATACGDDTVRVFNKRADGDPMHVGFDLEVTIPQAHTADVNCVKWSPDGELLASCSDDGVVKLWRFKSQ